MGVARATVQAIYGDARRKLAQCIVSGMELSIAGGDYELCPGASPLQTERNDRRMKIAVTYDENGQVFQHFGHCPQFKFYEVEDGKILSSEVISAGSSARTLSVSRRRLSSPESVEGSSVPSWSCSCWMVAVSFSLL